MTAARPDEQGHFGPYGGRYVPETLMEPLRELEAAYAEARRDPAFRDEFARLLRDYVGRPTPLTFAGRLSERLGSRVWLKREDLCHTGAHKINNALGQALLVKRMGKTRVVAETGAGQHGVASATVCALLGLECVVYMGTEDMARQAPNVRRMRLLGAEVRPVRSGSRTLKDAINEAMRDWVTNVRTTHYLLGSVLGAHPYPAMVRDFHAVIGEEARGQVRAQAGSLPDVLVACVGGGSNALGLFAAFFADPVAMVGVEAGGLGQDDGIGERSGEARGQGAVAGALLLDHALVDDTPRERPCRERRLHPEEHRGDPAFHVARAAPVHAPAGDLRAERLLRPAVERLGADDIHVPVHEKRTPLAVPEGGDEGAPPFIGHERDA